MADSKKSTGANPSSRKVQNVPTLTDVVDARPTPKAHPPVGENGKTASARPHAIDQRTLEKLIYKQLSRRLPQLCQELATDILAELHRREENTGKE